MGGKETTNGTATVLRQLKIISPIDVVKKQGIILTPLRKVVSLFRQTFTSLGN